jgi:TrmH family RNA methyltransferase
VAARKLWLRKERATAGAFLVDGVRVVRDALRSHRMRELFLTEDVAATQPELVRGAQQAGVRIMVVTDRVAKTLSETTHPQGAVAVVDIPTTHVAELFSARPRLLVVLAGIADPGNAGTVIRTAAAVGADGVIFGPGTVDPYGAKCVRASAGAVLQVPVVVTTDIQDVLASARDGGMQTLATAIEGSDLFTLDDDLRRPTTWLFGGEAHGLDDAMTAAADRAVRIPMTASVESLNLAGAAAVCLYASARALGTVPR